METLLLGIDAACAPVLSELLDRGAEVPTLRELLEEGASGPLESQIPPWTASAWPSMFTGTNPGKHGIFSFLVFEGYDWDVVNASHCREPTLWELLDVRGLTSVVVNVPVTHPPNSFSGALLPGYTAPEDPEGHPEGITEDVREEIGGYRVYPRHEGASDAGQEAMIENYRELLEMRGEAFRYLADRFAPEFGFLQFQVTDSVFHERPGDWGAVQAVYEALDEQVRETLEACEPATVIVASDHGMGKYDGYEFRANEFLREAGYVRSKRGGEKGMPAWGPLRDDEGSGEGEPAILERGMALAAKVGVTSQRVGRVVDALGLTDLVLEVVPQGMVRAGTEQVDFQNSRAYMRERIELGIRINLAGREPAGVVPESDYEHVREELIAALEDVDTPDGEPVFEQVAPREEFFQGSAAEEAVDIVTVPNEFDQFLSATLAGEAFGPPTEPWNHKRAGIVAARGAAIDATAPSETEGIVDGIENAHLFDIAPTVLATLSLPSAERMDGAALPVVESAGEEQYASADRGRRVATDDSAVESRLSDLGYIE
ncbi:phosphodiesterase [Halobacteriales archaeon QS_3_64_16]|nr:MAG: phosphodiesterase [Halobacteriales archaeon QS_3_64_16]